MSKHRIKWSSSDITKPSAVFSMAQPAITSSLALHSTSLWVQEFTKTIFPFRQKQKRSISHSAIPTTLFINKNFLRSSALFIK